MRHICLVLMLGLAGSGYAYDSVGHLVGEQLGDQFGSAITTVDFNADTWPDLAVGAPAGDEAGLSSGTVYIYYGGPAADTIADLKLIGAASSFFGQALASAGDYNGDSFEDLLVGAPFYDLPATSAGAVFLYYGGPSPDTAVDHIFTGENGSDYFGVSVAGIGDFNNDTYADIAVGAYRADWGTFQNAGKTYVYYGGPAADFAVDRVLVGEADGERFGISLTSGDFDNDASVELAVGAYSYDAGDLNVGRIYLFDGGLNPDTVFDMTITGDGAGYKFGWSLAAGRVSADAYVDLIMGADGYSVDTFSTGQVYLFHGGAAFDNVVDDSYTLGRTAHDFLGYWVASGVDLDSDGDDELVAGMSGNDDGGIDAGGALIFAGGSGLTVDTTILGSQAGEELGEAAALWPGYGNSVTHVIAIGASAYSDFTGRVLLLSADDPVSNNPPVLDSIGPKFTGAEATLTFNVSASDPDGGIPSLNAFGKPSGAAFTDNEDGTGHFEWLPALADTGLHEVLFVADDGELSDSEMVEITVLDAANCCDHRGNVDHIIGSFPIDVADLTYLVAFLFAGGPFPPCTKEGNVDAVIDGELPTTVADLTYLVAFLFSGGPEPPPCP